MTDIPDKTPLVDAPAPPRLSIAIPTYNFAAFLPATLASILDQAIDDVDVVVVDGASTDDTPLVMAHMMKQYPRLRYERLPAKGGIDRDMALAVDAARGEYCWLFSADDIMKPGAIALVLRMIRSRQDLYLSTHAGGNIDLAPVYDALHVLRAEAGEIFDLGDTADRRRYFTAALNTEAFFSFMGTLIVKRARWLEHELDERFVGSCWAHAARLLRMVEAGLTVTHIREPLLIRRGGNDSFLTAGPVKRLSLGVDGYNAIADTIFGRSSFEAGEIRRVLRAEFSLPLLLRIKMLIADDANKDSHAELRRLVASLGNGGTKASLTTLAVQRTPVWLIRAMVAGNDWRRHRQSRSRQQNMTNGALA